MVIFKNSLCLTPKWHFSVVNLNPAWRMNLKTARIFRVGSVAFLAAIPISLSYQALWSALTTGSNYSGMNLKKADTDLLRSCASLL